MMMQHITTDRLIDYIHGELAPPEDASVLTHLETCTDCAIRYAAEVQLSEILRDQAALEAREMPSMIKANLWQMIRESQPSYLDRLRAWLRPAYALPVAAAIIAAAYLGPTYLGHQQTTPSIDAAYYLQDHAAMNGSVPFGDRSSAAPAEFESAAASDQTAMVTVPVSYIADASH